MRYTVSSFQVDTDAQAPLGPLPKNAEYVGVPIAFLEAVGAELNAADKVDAAHKRTSELCCELNERVSDLMRQLAEAQQPRPLEQALAVLAQAWQSAVKPVEPERAAMPDVLLEAQRAGWDASRDCGGKVPSCPFPSGTALHEAFRTGWLMEDNGEERP